MAIVVDLTQQDEVTTFSGSSADDISYAANFWQSIHLHPPMESRLVSSDIKQRLKVAPPSSQARNCDQSRKDESPELENFMSRVKTMEHFEEYSRLQRIMDAKTVDRALLQKQREIRQKKEEISKNKGIKPVQRPIDEVISKDNEEYEFEEEDDINVIKQINDFEADKLEKESVSD